MMKTLLTYCFAFILSGTTATFAQNSISGIWKTEDNKYLVKIDRLGEKATGRIVWLENATDATGKPVLDKNNPNAKMRNLPIKGLKIIEDMVYNDENKSWEGGILYWPENGATYNCRITPKGNSLALTLWQNDPSSTKTMSWSRKQ
jgi:uncharacterized protein (DUF2147 family)